MWGFGDRLVLSMGFLILIHLPIPISGCHREPDLWCLRLSNSLLMILTMLPGTWMKILGLPIRVAVVFPGRICKLSDNSSSFDHKIYKNADKISFPLLEKLIVHDEKTNHHNEIT